MADIKTYSGRCHCGAVRFRFKSEELTTGCRCNCSVCIRKGIVMSSSYITPADFDLLEGEDALSVYRFGDGDVNHYFCTWSASQSSVAGAKPGRASSNCV